MRYQDVNARTVDRWAAEGWEWSRPLSPEACAEARQGKGRIFLTPTKPVPREWLGQPRGKRILGLAAGGGQQMPVLALSGGDCTLLDYSEAQLASDRALAEREGYPLRIVRADMTRPLPFLDESFDLIVHPVSNCYIREVLPLWRECFRVLSPGGVLLSGLDNGMNFIMGEDGRTVEYALPFDPLAGDGSPEALARLEAAGDGVQFSHTAEEQLGGQLRAGFLLTDLYEDTNGSGYLAEKNIPAFWATRAVKPGR